MPSGNASWAAILHPLGASSHLTIIPSRSLASRLPVSSGSKSVAPTTLPFPFARKQFCGAKEHGSTKDSGSCGEIDGSGDKFVIHDVDPYGVTRIWIWRGPVGAFFSFAIGPFYGFQN